MPPIILNGLGGVSDPAGVRRRSLAFADGDQVIHALVLDAGLAAKRSAIDAVPLVVRRPPAHMLGVGFLNSRLATRIRQKEGLSYGVGSQFNANSFDKVARFQATAIYAPENAARLEGALRDEIARVENEGITAA